MKKLINILIITFASIALMGQDLDTVNTGTGNNTGDGDPGRVAFGKVNAAIVQLNINTRQLDTNTAKLDSLSQELDTTNSEILANRTSIENDSTRLDSLIKGMGDSIYTDKIVLNGFDVEEAIFGAPELSAINIYVSEVYGSDVTGDGTIGNPFATLIPAIQSAPLKIGNVELAFHLDSGNYVFTENEVYELSRKEYSSTMLSFYGDYDTVETLVSFTESVGKFMTYDASKAGLTVTENEYQGYFIEDGKRFYPITYNSAGTDNFEAYYMRGGRSGTRNVVRTNAFLNLTTAADDRVMVMNFPGLSSIYMANLGIVRTGDDINFEYARIPYEFDFGCTWAANQVIIGPFNTQGISSINFVGNWFETTDVDRPTLEVRDYTGWVGLVRCGLKTANVYSNSYVVQAGNNGYVRIKESTFIGTGTVSAIGSIRHGVVEMSKTNIIYNCNGVFSSYYGYGKFIADFSAGYYNLLTRDTDYLIARYGDATEVDVYYHTDLNSSYVTEIDPGVDKVFIDQAKGIRFNLPGVYPEYSNPDDESLANGGSGTIQVGDITQNVLIVIDFVMTRETLVETGTITLTNKADTYIDVNVTSTDDAGIDFSKSISTNAILLGWSDVLTDGNATTLQMVIKRTILQ